MAIIVKENNEINIQELLGTLWSKIFWVLLSTALFLAAAFAFTEYYITPKYQSTAKIYVMNTKADVISTGDIAVATSLTSDYMEMVVGRMVLEQVISDLKLDMTYEQLRDCIKVENPTNTRILEITVTGTVPETARKISDAVCDVSSGKIVELLGADKVTKIENGNLPSKPSSPNLKKNLIIGGLLGLIISCGLITMIFILDDKIKSPEDIEKQLGLSVLGILPYQKKVDR